MTTKDTGFFSQILTKYLPLFAIFCSGALTIHLIAQGEYYSWRAVITFYVYTALLYFYWKAAKIESGHLFRVTLVGAIIITVGGYLKSIHILTLPGAVVVAIFYLWFIIHKKWV